VGAVSKIYAGRRTMCATGTGGTECWGAITAGDGNGHLNIIGDQPGEVAIEPLIGTR
jgi:hypothetical protein